jgi:hypothetical protein
MIKAKKSTPPTPEDYAGRLRTDAYFAGMPRELPAGFFDQMQPLARWIMTALVDAYRRGWFDGVAAQQDLDKHPYHPAASPFAS